MKVRKAVITAAGWGTRFLPLTKSQPKEMLPLLKKPLIQYSVEEAAACGAELIVIVTSQHKKNIADHFDRHFELEDLLAKKGDTEMLAEVRRLSTLADICYVNQKEQLGLGHAVSVARDVVGNEPFMLFLPDDIFQYGEQVLRHMLEAYEKYNGSVLAVQQVSADEVSRYGIIAPQPLEGRISKITALVEKPPLAEAPSRLAIFGRYVLSPEVFAALEETRPGRGGEIQLTDALQLLSQKQAMYGYEFEGKRYDTGTFDGWLRTTVEMALRDPETGPSFGEYLADLLRPPQK